MDNKTEAVKVTLRPKQRKKVKAVAKRDYEGNFSMALRVMIDRFEEEVYDMSIKHMSLEEAKELSLPKENG